MAVDRFKRRPLRSVKQATQNFEFGRLVKLATVGTVLGTFAPVQDRFHKFEALFYPGKMNFGEHLRTTIGRTGVQLPSPPLFAQLSEKCPAVALAEAGNPSWPDPVASYDLASRQLFLAA